MRARVSLGVVLVLVATSLVSFGVLAQDDPLPAEPPVATPEAAPAPAAPASPEAPKVKRIKMYAEDWKWTPREIRVAQGTLLQIDFESRDSSHSFEIKELGIKVPLPQDKKASYEFVVDRKGEFRWICGRPCGDGCPKMIGKLIVE
jgi:heme/copper-type cytochrome/quinol oxidase subunit 2